MSHPTRCGFYNFLWSSVNWWCYQTLKCDFFFVAIRITLNIIQNRTTPEGKMLNLNKVKLWSECKWKVFFFLYIHSQITIDFKKKTWKQIVLLSKRVRCSSLWIFIVNCCKLRTIPGQKCSKKKKHLKKSLTLLWGKQETGQYTLKTQQCWNTTCKNKV